MAKYPAPGRVKTRLAGALGDERACTLYRAFVLDLADRLAALPYAVRWAFWPVEAPFATLVPGAPCTPQRGRDLGERMANAFVAAFAEHPSPVVMIGADAPHVPSEWLAEAFTALADGADAVLGPAEDGGYYLIGLAGPTPGLFTGVPWSTSEVLDATLARAAGLGLATRLLAPSFDIDEPDDVTRLRSLLDRGIVELPRTAALLASWGDSRLGVRRT
jgi:rSAM/selenodomain-associated transferase 1